MAQTAPAECPQAQAQPSIEAEKGPVQGKVLPLASARKEKEQKEEEAAILSLFLF